ncbi:tape measure protein [Rhodococcus hoagii]|nr:tape measure protein [Prescottella equi]NKS73139.1 tape measure protein [Prescottella equi]NKZ92209.1 tape measure protein [Prescottella equi]
MATIGSAVLEIIPSARGIGGAIGQQIGGDLTSAGRAAGVRLGEAMADGVKSAKSAVDKATAQLAAAQTKQTDSIGKVQVAELRLQELRESGKAKASQLSAAENNLTTARNKANEAVSATARADQNLASAKERLKRATDDAASSHGRHATALAQSQDAMRGIGSVASDGATKLTRLGIAAAGAAAAFAGFNGIKNLIGETISAGAQRLSTIESATASLTVTMGDAGKATEFVGEMLKTVNGTPFNLDQFAKAGSNLVALGADAKEVPGYLTAIGNVAASKGAEAGEYVDRLTSAFGKIATTGKLSTEALQSIEEAGAPAFRILANESGKSVEDMQKLVTKGAIPAKEGLAMLVKGIMDGTDGLAGVTPKLGGQMEALRKTYDGALGGMKAARTRMGAAFLKPFRDEFVGVFNSASDAMGGFTPKLEAFSQKIVDTGIIRKFGESLADLPSKLEKWGTKVSEIWGSFKESDVAQDSLVKLRTIFDSLLDVAQTAGPALAGIGRSLSIAAGATGISAWTLLLDTLQAVGPILNVTIVPALQLASNLMTEHQGAVTALMLAYAGFKTIPSIIGVVGGAFEKVRGSLVGARDGIKGLGDRSIVAQMRESFTVGAVQASHFGASVAAANGTIRAGATGIRAGLSSLVNYMGGPFALGATAAVAGVTFAFSRMAEASRKVDESMKTIQQANERGAESRKQLDAALLSSGGKVDDGVLDVMTQKVKDFRAQQESLSGSGGGFWGQLANTFDIDGRALSAKSDEMARIGGQYVETLKSIKLEGGKAVTAFDGVGIGADQLGKILSGSQQDFDTFIKSFSELNPNNGFTTWLRQSRSDFVSAQNNADAVAKSFEKIGDKSISAARGVDEAAAAISRFAADKLVLEDAERRANETLDAFADALRNGGAAAVDVSGKIDTTTAAGRQLFDVVKQGQTSWGQLMAAAKTAAQEQGRSAEEATQAGIAAGDAFRADLLNTLTQMTGNADTARALLDRYLSTEGTYQAVMDADTKPAHAKLDALQARIAQPWTVAIQGILSPAPIPQPTGTGASIPLPSVLPMPGGAQHGARLPLPAFQGGGKMPGYGPGTERTDGIYAVTKDGHGVAMVDGEEWIVNSKSSSKYDRELREINAGTFPKLPGYEQGGRLALDRTATFLSRESGKPYQYGGVGNPSWDCSGFASAGYALMTGRNPYQRWFTTESDFRALGFVAGLNPNAVLNLGVMNGGGGMNSHMAGTLNGIPFESGSNGVRYGNGALGANDSSLPNRWHLPNELASPPIILGNYTSAPRVMTESDRIDLERARLAVDEARAKRDNPKENADENDRRSAQLAVREAENRLAELEQKQRGGRTLAPDAPALVSGLTDEQMDEEDALIARDEANERRNEVYADPESSPNDMRRADQALRRAEARLDELRSEQIEKGMRDSDGKRLKTFTELGSDLGGILAGGLLETFGLENSSLADPNGFLGTNSGDNVRTSDKLPKATGPSVSPLGPLSQAEMLSQAPFVWDPTRGPEQLLDIPGIKLFDNGGKLKHNALGLNLSGEDEAVLTGAETREWKRGNAAVDALMREIDEFRSGSSGGGSGGDGYLARELHLHGRDERAVVREMEMKMEARMGSSLGRYRW